MNNTYFFVVEDIMNLLFIWWTFLVNRNSFNIYYLWNI